MIGMEDGAWPDGAFVPVDAASGWSEACDDAYPGYRQQRYETEAQASQVAFRFRSKGFAASTEWVPDDVPSNATAGVER